MTCPGLHCPGCSDGQSLGIAGGAAVLLVLADAAVPWVADRIWWITGTVAMCFALATAASMWLERRSDRRAAAWGAAHGIRSRADVILPGPDRPAEVMAEPARPAIAAPQIVNIFNFGTDPSSAAAFIRRALPGTTENADPERN